MRVIRAEAMGWCFGVRDALELARNLPDPGSVAIHGELVHNEAVLTELEDRGFAMSGEDDRGVPERPTVMVTAHGVSDRERARHAAAGKQLVDTTCPLVARVHRAARTLEAEGRHVVVIGKPGHVEVRGITEDLGSFDVVPAPDAVRTWPAAKLGVLCQSTAAERDVAAIRDAIAAKNPHADIRFIDTVCQPTKDRQAALEALLDRVEAVVVVGGRNSNNTRRLADRCRERGVPVVHVQGPADLEPAWFEGYATVGLTAGTSTPDELIDAVERALKQMPVSVP